MQYLVQMRMSDQARPSSLAEGAAFVNNYIHPTLALCKELQEQRKILAGGPISGAIALALIVQADSPRELDDLLTALPVWPRMRTEVTPLTTFEDRDLSVRRRFAEIP